MNIWNVRVPTLVLFYVVGFAVTVVLIKFISVVIPSHPDVA